MIRRRVGRPGLLGTMARTAVIAGTATAVSGGIQRGQQERAQAAAAPPVAVPPAAVPPAAAPPAAAPPAAPPPTDDTIAQLSKLGELRQAGILDDTEFTAAKAKLLGI
ncbi:SHOCT domain-containing protein [Conyzicola sp.]|uniref:SHOCT domain-containing protein n=1 Tax=Conyzicola sp. TaxID=1969404 RepID=UPI003989F8D9